MAKIISQEPWALQKGALRIIMNADKATTTITPEPNECITVRRTDHRNVRQLNRPFMPPQWRTDDMYSWPAAEGYPKTTVYGLYIQPLDTPVRWRSNPGKNVLPSAELTLHNEPNDDIKNSMNVQIWVDKWDPKAKVWDDVTALQAKANMPPDTVRTDIPVPFDWTPVIIGGVAVLSGVVLVALAWRYAGTERIVYTTKARTIQEGGSEDRSININPGQLSPEEVAAVRGYTGLQGANLQRGVIHPEMTPELAQAMKKSVEYDAAHPVEAANAKATEAINKALADSKHGAVDEIGMPIKAKIPVAEPAKGRKIVIKPKVKA